MQSTEALRQAINAARSGRKQEARDLLLKIVEVQPSNEAAWIWLSGLVDSLEDQIIACENALIINPANEKVRGYLRQLQAKQESEIQQNHVQSAQELVRQAQACAESGDAISALRLAEQATQRDPKNEDAWLLMARFSSRLSDRISALEKAHAINPSNAKTRSALSHSRQLRDDPFGLASHYEQVGQLDKALKVYNDLAATTRNTREFDLIYSNILRIEKLKTEKIQYVAPKTSILRLTFGWPLLYIFLVLIQAGLNPFRHFNFILWSGLPVVILGSFLLSLSEVRTRHAVWKTLFSEDGDGSRFARLVTATAGWMLVIFPHLLLLIDSLNRLLDFRIPPEPL
jgi:tetratricopeptide (TPR) repeat protein